MSAKVVLELVSLLWIYTVYGFECVYEVDNGEGPPYTLNLTLVSEWTLELPITINGKTASYYYTPCRNGITCSQGNSQFTTNVAEFDPFENQCNHYLAIDHKQSPTYSDSAASFIFAYEDGEFCDVTQQSSKTTIYWTCAENGPLAYMNRVEAVSDCDYHITIESSLACVPENTQNANCQYSVETSSGSQRLNLAPLRNIDPLGFDGPNGYRVYYSPCRNALNCYQQSGTTKVMSVLDNTVTDTCERYIATWEDGLHKPSYSAVNGGTFEFRYYNGQPCDDGAYGSEERITFICERLVETAKVINVTVLAPCRIDYFVASKLACASSYDDKGNLIV